jgi:membrane protease YdiL (CAAX protease family)
MPGERQLSLTPALGLWAVLALTAAFYGTWLGYGGRGFAITLAILAMLLAGEILLAARGVRERLTGLLGPRGGPLMALLLLPALLLAYLIYALGTNSFLWWRAALATAFISVPLVVLASVREQPAGAWQDYLAMLLIWLPVKLHWLRPLWPYPNERLSYVLAMLLAINVAVAGFLLVRRLEGVGYTVAWGRGSGTAVGLNFALAAVILIPLGEAIGFLHFAPAYAQLQTLPLVTLGIFFFTAWPEEFLFRGLLQNSLSRTLGGATRGWLAASVLFGFAHITNGNFPNWQYVLLAAIAGLLYGRAWRRTGSLFPSALVHMLVDVTWRFLFR